MHATLPLLKNTRFPALRRAELETVQVNLGYRCNQRCLHCHVNAGPTRKEQMSPATIDELVAFLQRTPAVKTLDLTGGAPELNPEFRKLVRIARSLGLRVIDRCNLTILQEPGHEDLADFLATQGVEIVASLPCYLQENVDLQRGKGVFEASLRSLRQLNDLGYGKPDSGLRLDLVYNPQGAELPPPQHKLELDYKAFLGNRYGIVFNSLLTIANMPIQRFGSTLVSRGLFDDYLQTLHEAHQACNLDKVMCRSLISVDWQGFLYDCDFNQQLGLALTRGDGTRLHISTLDAVTLKGAAIHVAEHCYGCTAGQGSGCGGAFVES